jgi:hypothetical protein
MDWKNEIFVWESGAHFQNIDPMRHQKIEGAPGCESEVDQKKGVSDYNKSSRGQDDEQTLERMAAQGIHRTLPFGTIFLDQPSFIPKCDDHSTRGL